MSTVGSCCPFCLADWTDESKDKIEVMETEGPSTLQCKLHDEVLVSPEDVSLVYDSPINLKGLSQ